MTLNLSASQLRVAGLATGSQSPGDQRRCFCRPSRVTVSPLGSATSPAKPVAGLAVRDRASCGVAHARGSLGGTIRATFGGALASLELWFGRSGSDRYLSLLCGLVTRVSGRIPFGASCPKWSLAREASTLSLATYHAGFSRHGIDPVGETSIVPVRSDPKSPPGGGLCWKPEITECLFTMDKEICPNAAEPQPKRASAHTTNAPRFAVTDVILSAVHPALRARLSRPLVYVSGCYGCRTSA